MTKNFKPVTHCIFDMDGLMLNTEEIYFQLTQEILEKYEKQYTWEAKKQIMGMNVGEMSEKIVELFELPISPDEYLEQHKELCMKYMKDVQIMPGAESLLRHLTSNNILCAMGTASPIEFVELKFTNHAEVYKLFSHAVCGATDPDVVKGKPEPDIFLVAAKRFSDSPEPKNVLVFEDAPNGVQAAINAGMQVVMVPDKRVSAEDREKATQVLESLLDFKPEDFGLPSFPDDSSAAAVGIPDESKKPGAPTTPATAIRAREAVDKPKKGLPCSCDT